MHSLTHSRPRSLALTTGIALLAGLGLAAAQPAGAQNLLFNGDFESPSTASFTVAPTPIPGFTSGGDNSTYGVTRVDVNGGSLYGTSASDPDGGTQFGYLGYATTLTQTLDGTNGTTAAALQAGTLYTFSGAIGYRADQTTGNFDFDPLTFSLIAGGQTLASQTYQPDPTGHYGTFVPFSFTFDSTTVGQALLGQTLAVEIAGTPTDPSRNNQGNFDALSLTAAPAVPEASTTVSLGLLLTLGMGGLIVAAKKKRTA
jgi:hypothetical protein